MCLSSVGRMCLSLVGRTCLSSIGRMCLSSIGRMCLSPVGRTCLSSIGGTQDQFPPDRRPANAWRTRAVAPRCKGLWLPLTSVSWKEGDGKGND